MDDGVRAFQKQNPGVAVGLITLPPGLLLEAIEKGGLAVRRRRYSGGPDVCASASLWERMRRLAIAASDTRDN